MESTEHDGRTDLPLAGLPPADRRLLKDSPVEVAVAEVKFVAVLGGVPADAALAFQAGARAVGFDFPRFEACQQQRVQFEITDQGAQPSVDVSARGWQFLSPDGALTVTLMPDSLVLQQQQYRRWRDSLRAPLRALAQVAAEVLAPEAVQRLGLRFVNRLADREARSPADWQGRIHDGLLAAALMPWTGPRVTAAQQQIDLRLGDTQGAIIRHGLFVDPATGGAWSYLLDLDVFDNATGPFDPDGVEHGMTVLNRTVASLFQEAVLLAAREQMGTYTDPDQIVERGPGPSVEQEGAE